MRVLLDNTSWDTSLMILAFSLGDRVVNHFARRWIVGQHKQVENRGGPREHEQRTTLPCLDSRIK